MSRIFHGSRIFVAAGLLAATLMAPTILNAQTIGSQRALLNNVVSNMGATSLGSVSDPGRATDPNRTNEGERSLLGRVNAAHVGAIDLDALDVPFQSPVPVVDGERALLSNWASAPERRRLLTGDME
jgi:hypothetical protein